MSPRSLRVAAIVACGLVFLLAPAARAERIEVRSTPVPLNPSDLRQDRVGRLRFRGGLALTSTHPRFGGLSALRLSEGGVRVTFVSDEGSWLTAHLVHDPRGFLTGLADTELGPLLDLRGEPLAEKEEADAESLASMPDGSLIVGFEHHHRLWRYPAAEGRPDGTPAVVAPPPGIENAPANGGLEALVTRSGGELVALTEYWIVDQRIRGWTNGPAHWQALSYRFEGAFRPSDMARLPSGDFVVLERAYDAQRGIVSTRLRLLRQKDVVAGADLRSTLLAELGPPLSVDNFEGVDAVSGPKGETLLYVVSDDNFRKGEQRTLLLMFSLD